MTQNPQRIAVITGELVTPTELGPERIDKAFAALGACGDLLESLNGAPLHLTRHRGDGWQAVLKRPELALRAALAFRAALRAEGAVFDSHFGLAEGNAPGEIGTDLNAETGAVFSASGRALARAQSLKQAHMIHAAPGAVAAATALADHISSSWTDVQAQTIKPFLVSPNRASHTNVARMLGKSRQAVAKSVEGAGLSSLTRALEALEGADMA